MVVKACRNTNCKNLPNVIPLGYGNFDFAEIGNYNCNCGEKILKANVSRLIFYQSNINIKFGLNDKDETIGFTNKEAKGNDVIILGNTNQVWYAYLKANVTPSSENANDIEHLAEAGLIEVD